MSGKDHVESKSEACQEEHGSCCGQESGFKPENCHATGLAESGSLYRHQKQRGRDENILKPDQHTPFVYSQVNAMHLYEGGDTWWEWENT